MSPFSLNIRHCALFIRLPFIGQAFLQVEDKHPMHSWSVRHQCHRGEHLVWFGRLHLMLTLASVTAAIGQRSPSPVVAGCKARHMANRSLAAQ
jgi:hypothetical protein